MDKKINGDRFPKQRVPKVKASKGVQAHASLGNVLDLASTCLVI